MKRFCAVLLVVLAVASVFGEMQIIDALGKGWYLFRNTDPFTDSVIVGVVGFASDYSFVLGATQEPTLGFGIDYGLGLVYLTVVSNVVVFDGPNSVMIRFDNEEPVSLIMIGDAENVYRLTYVFVVPDQDKWLLKKLFTAKTLRVKVNGILSTQSMSFDLEPLQAGFKKHELIKEVEKLTGIKVSTYLKDSYF